MCLGIFDIICCRDAADCVGVLVLVCEIALCVQINDLLGPLNELILAVENNVSEVGHNLGALTLDNDDFLSVDETRVLDWHIQMF